MYNGSYGEPRRPAGPRSAPVVLLGVTAGLGPFTIDSYLPALPELVSALGSREGLVQLTLAATMVGFAVGQLLVGPWSDRVGRRIPLIAGLSLLIAASVAAAVAGDITQLLFARLLQGAGAATAAVTALASARDAYSAEDLVRAIGLIALTQSIAPLVAPIAGGIVMTWVGWRGVFVLLAAYALTVLCLLAPRLPRRVRPLAPAPGVRARYRRLARDRQLIVLLVLAGLRFTALFTFLQWSPFLLQRELGVSPAAFGVLFALMTLGMMVGLQISPLAIRRGARPVRVLWASLIVMALGAVLLTVGSAIALVVSACAVFLLGCGIGLPTLQTLALADHAEDAGTVAGLIGAVGFGSAGLLAPVLALLPQAGLDYRWALALVMGAVVIGSGLVLSFFQRTAASSL